MNIISSTLLSLVLLLAGGTRSSRAQNAPETTDLDAALAAAATGEKRMFVLFGRNTCGNCKALKGYIAQQTLRLPSSQFIYLFLNCDDTAISRAFYARYSVIGNTLPYVVITDATGQQLLARSGYGTAQEFQEFVDLSGTLQPPANDAFACRTPLAGSRVEVDALNSLATKEPGEPRVGFMDGGASVWWEWTAPSSGFFTVTTEGSVFRTLLAVYTGSEISELVQVAQNSYGGAGGTSRLVFNAQAGTAYPITVDGIKGYAGHVHLLIRPANPPPNDRFASRTLVTGWRGQASASNVDGSREAGEPNHANVSGGSSVWWTWTAPASGPATLSTAGSGIDTVLAVYTGSNLTALERVASNDDDGDASTSLVTFDAFAGTTYQIAVDGYNGATGDLVLSLSSQPPTFWLALVGRPTAATARLQVVAPLGQTTALYTSTDLRQWERGPICVQTAHAIEVDVPTPAASNGSFFRAVAVP